MTVWSLVRLGDVSEIIAGQSPSGRHYNTGQEGLPFYQGKKDFGDRFIKPAKTWTREYSKVAEKGDILMSVRAPVGPVNMAIERCAIGRGLASIRPTGRVETGYVFYYLRSIEGKLEYSEGAVFSSISKHQIADIQLPLPPLAEQKRIVAKLDQASEALMKLIENVEELEKLEQTLWACVLNQATEPAPTKLSSVALSELVEILDGKRKPITKSDREPGNIPYYGATGVVDYVKDYLFDEPLVLLGEDGAKWGKGDTSAFCISGKAWVNNHAHVLRPNRQILLDKWLVYCLQSMDLSDFITGATVLKLNQSRMRDIPILLPPLAEQRRIVAKLDQINDTLSELRRLRAARNAALEAFQKSFSSTSFSQAA